jgi:DNA-binding CsgD family transcriptional regulator
MFDRVDGFVREVGGLETEEALAGALARVTLDLGYRYFALTHHVDVGRTRAAIRIHNYPREWARWFDEQKLGQTDPVHRASHMTSIGFPWSCLDRLIALSGRDREILEAAREQGIGDGFTVPAHVPGEAHGSVSFAAGPGEGPDSATFPLMQLVGAFSFEAARRIRRLREPPPLLPRLTERQRECVTWAARGKSDWEISRILGLSHETVIQHLKEARERYGVPKRTLLTVHALFDGTIAFFDVLRR